MNHRASVVVRLSLAVLFLWFGYQQVVHPNAWIGFLPEFTASLPMSAQLFVKLNGVMELILGLTLAVGLFTRLSALVLGLHLLGIAIHVGTAIDAALGMRDLALAACTIALALTAPDAWTLDVRCNVFNRFFARFFKKPAA